MSAAPVTVRPPAGGYGPPQPGYPLPGGYPPVPMAKVGVPQGWMPIPRGIPNCPPGLEYLTIIDRLLVKQQMEICETINKYHIYNSMEQKIYFGIEDMDRMSTFCCGSVRPFNIKILDNSQNEVIHLYQPVTCASLCFPCCLQTMDVFAPPGTLVGRVKQNCSLCASAFSIENAAGDTVLKIKRLEICSSKCCADVVFKVLSPDGQTKLGKITKQWTNKTQEVLTIANFRITFPMDLDVNIKAVMLGACLLIDFLYFEKPYRHTHNTRIVERELNKRTA